MLTKEESLMMVVRNLEATHSVGGNAIATKVLVKDIGDNAKGIGWNGTQYFLDRKSVV